MRKFNADVARLVSCGLEIEDAVECARKIHNQDHITEPNVGNRGLGRDVTPTPTILPNALRVVPQPTTTNRLRPHQREPLARYRSLFEWMQATMTHLCRTPDSCTTAEELWGEMMKGSSRGGRGHMPAQSTFINYLYWYSNGTGQAKGTRLWKRVGRGKFQPV